MYGVGFFPFLTMKVNLEQVWFWETQIPVSLLPVFYLAIKDMLRP